MKNLLITKDDQRFETTSKIKLANETMGIKEVELKLDIQNSGMNAQTNFEVNLSVLRLRGAVQIRDNGDIYVKVKDLPALLSSDFASGAGIPEEMKANLFKQRMPPGMVDSYGKKTLKGILGQGWLVKVLVQVFGGQIKIISVTNQIVWKCILQYLQI